MASSRESGILAMPVWPCWIFAGSGSTPVNQRKTVVLPEPENPTNPTFMVFHRNSKLGQPARHHVRFPLVQQRPIDGAGTEIGHVLILRQPINRLLNDGVVASE